MPPPVKLASADTVPRSSEEGYHQSNPTVLGPLSADIVPPADHAPSVTVFTNIAGAVAVTVDRDSSISARRRLSSKPLPENPFNPFRDYENSRRRQLGTTPQEKQRASSAGATAEAPAKNVHVASAAAAAVAVEGIKKGVRDALDRWALQT